MFVIDPFFNGLVPGRNFVVPIWIRAGKRFSGGPPVEMTALLVGIVACRAGAVDMGMGMGMDMGHVHGHGHGHGHVTCVM